MFAVRAAGCHHAPVDFALDDDLRALAAEAEAVAAEWAGPLPEDSWMVGHSREFSLELARRGWLGMTWPVEHGGGGRAPLERFVVYEALIAGGAPVAYSWFADRQIGPTLLRFGTDEQRAAFLPSIIDGTAQWCVGMSEPDAGSDVASLRTRAERTAGGDWLVNGAKVWMSGAATGDWCYLIARTDPEAPPHKGLSELVVALDSPGVDVRPIQDLTGGRHFCEVTFTDVVVPASTPATKPSHTPQPQCLRSGWRWPSQPLKSPTTRTACALGAQTAKAQPVTPCCVVRCAPSLRA